MQNEAENLAATKYIKENSNTDFTLFCNNPGVETSVSEQGTLKYDVLNRVMCDLELARPDVTTQLSHQGFYSIYYRIFLP